MKRVFVIVLDSFGIGELPDAPQIIRIAAAIPWLLALLLESSRFPTCRKWGCTRSMGSRLGQPVEQPAAAYGRMAERSAGKDTTTGHWELMGLGLPKNRCRPIQMDSLKRC